MLYINMATAKKDSEKIIAHVNKKSVVAFDGPGSFATAATPKELFEIALAQKKLIYIQYEEGDGGTSLFTALDEQRIKDLLARAKKGE